MEIGQKIFVIVNEVEWDEAEILSVNGDGTFNIDHEDGEYENLEAMYIAETKPEKLHTNSFAMYEVVWQLINMHNNEHNMNLTFPEMHKIRLLIWRSPEILALSTVIVDVISTIYSKRE